MCSATLSVPKMVAPSRMAATNATSRLILVARAFVDIEDSARIKLTRKHWECAGITDKDTRSRVIAKIKRECPDILLDAQQGRCTYIEFKRL